MSRADHANPVTAITTDASRAYESKRRTAFGLLALSAGVLLASEARADIVQIPAITFVGRSNVETVGDDNKGTFTNGKGVFYAPVPFTTNGDSVCRFTLVHRDNDTDTGIAARLLKKRIRPGQPPFDPPIEMAAVDTTAAGATAGVEKLYDRSIRSPVIDVSHSFYYVELTVEGPLLEVLGVQILVQPTCP